MILVDGMLLARRCDSKMNFLKNADGVSTGMEFGFLKTLKSIAKKLNDDDIVVCWEGGKLKRKEIDKTYKANRDATLLPPSFWTRLKRLQSNVASLHKSYYCPGFEADDVLGTLAKQFSDVYEKVYIYTNDKDLLQVVSGNIYVVTSHQSQLWLWDEEEVINEFGVSGQNYIFLKAFLGDAGDNIIGVKRVRKKTVVKKILSQEGTKGEEGSIVRLVECLWAEAGYNKPEYEAVLNFPISNFVRNISLVKLYTVEPIEIEGVSKEEFSKYLEQLSIRSLSYEEF